MRRAALLWGVFVLPGNGALFHAEAERVFPMNHTIHLKKQLRCIYLSNFFSGLRITDAVWVALLAARGFSLWEIGLAESIYHIVSLLCEVPSGMAADLLGRKRALVAGGILAVLSSLLMAFAPGLFLICAAMGLNCPVQHHVFRHRCRSDLRQPEAAGGEERYLSVAANRSQIGMLASALGSLASTLRRFLRFSGFYLVSALFSSISTLAMLLLKEPVVTEAQAARSSHSLRELPGQFAQLVRDVPPPCAAARWRQNSSLPMRSSLSPAI